MKPSSYQAIYHQAIWRIHRGVDHGEDSGEDSGEDPGVDHGEDSGEDSGVDPGVEIGIPFESELIRWYLMGPFRRIVQEEITENHGK